MYNHNDLSRMRISLSVIIITYNSDKFIKKCLLSAINSSVLPEEIIVIDNNSPKSPLKIINSIHLGKVINFRYIKNKNNLGFAKAVNQGVKMAKQNHVMFLNKDALFKIWKQLKKEKVS